jgi:hypothetical protein
MSFIPVKLDTVNCTIFQANGGNAFQFAPAPLAEGFTQTTNLAYPVADSDYFYLFDLTDNLELFIHMVYLFKMGRTMSEGCAVV